MTSPAELVEPRRKLTRMEIIEICVRQSGRCGCGCGHRLDPFSEGVIDEHLIPLELTGSNDLRNRALFRKPCAVEKTKKDASDIARAKRRAGETCAGPSKRQIPARVEAWAPKGSRKLPSRPFPKRSLPSQEN